jgi:hypothetical protein
MLQFRRTAKAFYVPVSFYANCGSSQLFEYGARWSAHKHNPLISTECPRNQNKMWNVKDGFNIVFTHELLRYDRGRTKHSQFFRSLSGQIPLIKRTITFGNAFRNRPPQKVTYIVRKATFEALNTKRSLKKPNRLRLSLANGSKFPARNHRDLESSE